MTLRESRAYNVGDATHFMWLPKEHTSDLVCDLLIPSVIKCRLMIIIIMITMTATCCYHLWSLGFQVSDGISIRPNYLSYDSLHLIEPYSYIHNVLASETISHCLHLNLYHTIKDYVCPYVCICVPKYLEKYRT